MAKEAVSIKTKIRLITQKLAQKTSPIVAKISTKLNWPELQQNLKQRLNWPAIREQLENYDAQKTLEWINKTIQKRGAAFYGTLATIILSTYFISNVTALFIGEAIPDPLAQQRHSFASSPIRPPSFEDYQVVFTRNLFNSRGIIPGEEIPSSTTPGDTGGPAVKSTLPFNLVGTLIMSNELLSIATIEDKGAGMVYPVRVEDEIPDKARIVKIEPTRVTFINRTNGHREYIELPEDAQSQNPKIVPGRPRLAGAVGEGIERTAPNQFNISKTEIDRAMGDFNQILTQARAVPASDSGIAGFRLFQIVPGSIYEKLGLQNGDFISGINGQAINDPTKAFEMLSQLKTANHLELQLKRDGKQLNYNYDINP